MCSWLHICIHGIFCGIQKLITNIGILLLTLLLNDIYASCTFTIYFLTHVTIQIGYQPVHLAAMNGHVKLVEYLVSENRGLIDAVVAVRAFVKSITFVIYHACMMLQNGALLIHFASLQGDINMFKTLTKLGSDPRIPSKDSVS